jgi:RNA polymerase-binding protein DksA
MITKELSKELHDQLLSEKKRLEHEIANISGVRSDVFLEDETDSVDQHPADDATELFEREKNLTVRRTLEISLEEINQALHRFEEGTYGTCEHCGKPISEKRLRAMPGATHCIDCQAKLEKQAQAVGR